LGECVFFYKSTLSGLQDEKYDSFTERLAFSSVDLTAISDATAAVYYIFTMTATSGSFHSELQAENKNIIWMHDFFYNHRNLGER